MKTNILMAVCAVLALCPTPASAADLPICTGTHRAEHKLTCIVDGDTGWENGVKWRLLAIDAPEISHAACPGELSKAIDARDRLSKLLSRRYKIMFSGKMDRSGRALVHVKLHNGRDAGKILLSEGLAQPWPNTGNIWCSPQLSPQP